MSGEKDLEQLKKEAVAKAKAEALAKRQAKLAGESAPKPTAVNEKAPEETLAKPEASAPADNPAPSEASAPADNPAPSEAAAPVESPAPTETAAPAGDDAKAKAAAAAKAKAAAAAKAKAAALAKQSADTASEPVEAETALDGDDAKAKAIAAAKAKAVAAAKAKAAALAKQSAGTASETVGTEAAPAGDDAKAKAIAAAKAKAAAVAKAKATVDGGETPAASAAPATPSVNQHFLDKYIKVIEENLGEGLLEDSYINKLSKDVPTLVVKRDAYFKVAQFLKYNERLGFDYVSELHGTDFETHMEVYVHLFSYKNKQSVALKVKIDRKEPTLESVVSLWPGANWPECEAYDLLGIKFAGHPNLHRILLGDDWIGHPQRKDYEPYDVEV